MFSIIAQGQRASTRVSPRLGDVASVVETESRPGWQDLRRIREV